VDGSDDTSYLIHYGVRGMRWGIRRSKERTDTRSADVVRVDAAKKLIRKHGTKSLSNADLQAVVNRMNLERQYTSLKPNLVNPNTVKTVNSILNVVGKKRVKDIALKGITKAVKIALL
jgi:hypothetical protein